MATITEALDIALQRHKVGDLDAAEQIYRQVLSIEPGNADALHLLGMVAYQRGQFADAITSINQAIQVNSSVPEFHNNVGEAYRAISEFDQAAACYRRAVELRPKYDVVHNNLGIVLHIQGKLEEAVTSFRQALACRPTCAEAHSNLGNVLVAQGQLDEALACYGQALQIKPDFVSAHSNLLSCLCANPDYDPEAIFAKYTEWYEKQAAALMQQRTFEHIRPDPARRLRVGYVSADFCFHAASYFLEPLLATHDRANVEVFCYSAGRSTDQVTRRFQAMSDSWRPIADLPDEAVADLVYTDRIDILVDLSGHTRGGRLLVFARKPAPVQVTFLGSLTTTGLAAIDYKLTDRFLTPDGTAERFSEELVRLPHCFVCYQPPHGAPPVAPQPFSQAGNVTFGSFNNLSKLTPAVAGLWARILHALPDAKLVLKYASLTDACQQNRYLDLFARNGIPAERIELLGGTLPPAHLADYSRVDIGLDPFPYGGCTTTCEALWMGVPVVTLAGVMSYSRFGVSLLSNLGMEDLIAKTPDEYVEKAVALANDRKRLTALRAELRPRMAASVLCDAKAFARDVERAYRSMWRKWCGSHACSMMTVPEILALALQHHQAGRLPQAETLYRQILQAEPNYSDAIHLLGVIAHQVGKHDAAIDCISRAIALNPNVAEYHNNIGEVYRAQGKKAEAVACYEKALTLKPDYADSHNNLGVALQDFGRQEEAVDHFQSAVTLSPDSFQAHYNLGKAFMESGEVEQAMEQYRLALALRPGDPAAVNDYALALLSVGDVEALAGFVGDLQARPPVECTQAQLRALPIFVAMAEYFLGEFGPCRENVSLGVVDLSTPDDFPNRRVLVTLRNYLAGLLEFHKSRGPAHDHTSGVKAECYAVGDSHCLSPAWTAVALQGKRRLVVPRMVIGCKAWHLAKDGPNRFKRWFRAVCERMPAGAPVICMVGEIDCQIHDGILPFHKKHPERDLLGIIHDTVEGYVACVADLMRKKGIRPYLQGVPAPHRDLIGQSGRDGETLVRIIREFNRVLVASADRYGYPVIDVYGMIAAPDGISNGLYHLDWYHLRPDYLEEALAKHLVGSTGSYGREVITHG